MKIRNEQLSALQEAEARKKSQAPQEGFAAFLEGEIGKATAAPQANAAQAAALGELAGLDATSLTSSEAVNAVPGLSETAALAADQVENLFSSLEGYGNSLASGGETSLREAYGLLEQTAGQLTAFRAAFPNLEGDMPELAAMVNELDVLTTTEMFKFNRGDYL